MRFAIALSVVLSAWLACGHQIPVLDDGWQLDEPSRVSVGNYTAFFLLTWDGARIGDASESVRRLGNGYRFERLENISVKRRGLLVVSRTRVTIDTDLTLRASRVAIRTTSGAAETLGWAIRTDRGWKVSINDEPDHYVDGDAVPAELVPVKLAVLGKKRFDGPVLLSGHGFAVAVLKLEPTGARTLQATLRTPMGVLKSEILLSADGVIDRVDAGPAVGSVRVQPDRIHEQYFPPEIVSSSSVKVHGKPSGVVLLDNVSRQPPPPLPGQSIVAGRGHWRVRFEHTSVPAEVPVDDSTRNVTRESAKLSRLASSIVQRANAKTRHQEIVALARATDDLLVDDYDTPGVGANAALALGRGDCTAHAALFKALANARGIDSRLVTGFRLDDDQMLVRHRWAVAAVDDHWLSVDPTFGEAPTKIGRHIGLAIHGSSAAELGIADELAFAGMRQVAASFERE